MPIIFGCENNECLAALMNSAYEDCETVTQEFPTVWGVCQTNTCPDRLKVLFSKQRMPNMASNLYQFRLLDITSIKT